MGSMTKDAAGVPLQYVDASPATTAVGRGMVVTNGLEVTGRSAYSTVPVGSVAYGSFATSAVHVAGTIYVAELVIERNFLATGVKVLNGATAATDKLIAILYDSAGNVVATSALAGTLAAGTNAFQTLAFTATVDVPGPARYYIGIQANGTTTTTRRIAASTFIDCLTKSFTGVFGTIPALTVPTTFTADVGPVAYVY